MSGDDLSRATKAEIEEHIAAEVARRRNRGEPMIPLRLERPRGPVAATFWGAAWCERMEACGDYRDRLPIGRSRLRAGAVYDLTITTGEVFAYVASEDLHEVLVRVQPIDAERREALVRACGGRVGNVVDLLAGNLSETVVAALVDAEYGLLPAPDEIRFQCDCPDHAGLCVHGAAVLYATGLCLDADPALLFTLRGVDQASLVSCVVSAVGQLPSGGEELLKADDLGAMFGIQFEEEDS